jgi:hypothetical protein
MQVLKEQLNPLFEKFIQKLPTINTRETYLFYIETKSNYKQCFKVKIYFNILFHLFIFVLSRIFY